MSNEQKKKVLPFFVNFSIAGLAGMGSAVFVHPLEVLKFRMQLSGEKGTASDHKNSFHAIINMAKNEKLSGFYKGITANFMRQIVFTSTRVGCYTSLIDELKKRGQGTVINNAIASMSTGALAAFISTPTDIAVVRMTADGRLPAESRRNYKGVFDALIKIRKDEGITGLWRGTVATILRAMTANLTQLMSYDEAKVYMMENYNMENGLKLHTVSSMISGIVYSVCSNPMDVLKTRIQQQKIVDGKAEYSGIIEVATTLVKSEGVMALWKGWPFYYLRVAPGTVLLFIFMEQLRKGYEDNFIKDQ
ncbi:mitochondrial 2-oxoglutarate/malate carrier protein-like isoform X1 [Acyrthosiphon pisum]|uniref:Mitochondrial 2-oxoglutarate/malate carrier protein n=2 Tax=Acyrthosiphon pisum TaxID=7029 RepID=A0A8R1W1G8_ACYPI|nr:mitochondrial 2-oxoglutarate/malate carrier protein-like isoform X1 [Acyrthosiphon pisum]|eukprot:XP_001948394.1 PREDICTED: mitochondrial 2-oxoglutarate/malate carrier protein-like isoform X1 [Acyrthosiphon pisum]